MSPVLDFQSATERNPDPSVPIVAVWSEAEVDAGEFLDGQHRRWGKG